MKMVEMLACLRYRGSLTSRLEQSRSSFDVTDLDGLSSTIAPGYTQKGTLHYSGDTRRYVDSSRLLLAAMLTKHRYPWLEFKNHLGIR